MKKLTDTRPEADDRQHEPSARLTWQAPQVRAWGTVEDLTQGPSDPENNPFPGYEEI